MDLRGRVHDQKKAMNNLFDLSSGMSSTDKLTDRARIDGSPACRSWQDVKRTVHPAKVYANDKVGASNWSSSRNKSNASPLNVALEKEMSKELESKKKSPSVVARLMGLEEDLPGQEPSLHPAKRKLKKRHLNGNLAETNNLHQHQEQYHCSMRTCDRHIGPKETVEFKDVYEVSEEPLRTYHLHDQTFPREMSSRSKRDIRMEIVRQNFMEAKRLATNEKLLDSKEFQDALEVLSSNRDLFLKFLEEPNSTFSKQLGGLHRSPSPPQTKRITVLKPTKFVESECRRENRTHRKNEENEHVMPRTHRRSHSAEVTLSQPTRIVVLKPSPGKPSRTMARLTPQIAPAQLIEQIGFYGGLEDDNYPPDGLHRRDESLLSSVYSNGYGGDESSFGRSEVDYIDEEDGTLSDSEIVSPVSRHSWDNFKRYDSPCSCSAFSRTSRSPESSVIREAKKRLSERCASLAYNETNHEKVQFPRSSSTLGEMLSLQRVKSQVGGMGSVSSSRPCDAENEMTLQATCITALRENEGDGQSSPKTLARSKSVPVSSSMSGNVEPDAPSPNCEGCKTPNSATRSDKVKPSFEGRVSSFFFPRSKRQSKEKTIVSASSDWKVEVSCFGSMKPHGGHSIGAMPFCEDKDDSSTTKTICSSKDIVSIEVPISPACPSERLDGLRSGGLNGSHDEPSPTSVLDVSFEDSNTNGSESSRCVPRSNERIASPSDANESVTRSLSWEDMSSPSPSPSLDSTNLTPLSSVDNDELECVAFVQKIVSSAGLGGLQLGMVFTGWYLPDCPLDPALRDRLLDRKEEAAKSRERRSNQRLLFDYVNMALLEIGHDTLLRAYPWRQQARPAMAGKASLSQALAEQVPHRMRDWLCGSGKFALDEDDDAGSVLERAVRLEVEGGGWVRAMRWELDGIAEQIAGTVLEEMVEDAAGGLGIWSLCMRNGTCY